ncbi:hypothetical protein [Brachybacterium sp. GPGPB12]|uniref:hypothetical protein n=1 Tax=Brachybacterium sp. GPGPB12 TaxID=3023517 RepID=UPI00313462F2
MASDSSALRALAHDLGVSTRYWGWDGTEKDVADSTLHAILAALGSPVASDGDIAAVRARRERAPWERTLPPVTVMRENRSSSVPVHVEHGTPVTVHVLLEEGGRVDLVQGEDHTPAHDLDGTRARPRPLPVAGGRRWAGTGWSPRPPPVPPRRTSWSPRHGSPSTSSTRPGAPSASRRSCTRCARNAPGASATSPTCATSPRSPEPATARTSCW